MNDYCIDCKIYKTDQNLQYEELGIAFLQTQLQGGNAFNREEMENKLFEKYQDDKKKKEINSPSGLSFKEERDDGFLNKDLRSLNIAAFLRCLYASIEFAPNQKIRDRAIRYIKNVEMFRTITQLCDSTDWDEKANIGSKYLRVMRNIIKLPIK